MGAGTIRTAATTASANSPDKVGLTHEAPLELEGFVNHFIGT